MLNQRLKQIQVASWVGIIGNSILALLKVSLGLISGSLAVVGDGIDSATDILSFLIIFFATRIMSKAPDKKHPYGHLRAETLATLIIAFIILFAGIQLMFTSIIKLASANRTEIPSLLAIIVTFFSVFGKLFLSIYQFKIAKKTKSSMLNANGRNMLSDIFISLGVLVGLLFTITLKMPLIDPMVAILISIWIVRTAIHIFLEANTELMEGIEDTSIYEEVFTAVKKVKNVSNPHRTRVRKLSNLYLIDIDIEVDGELTVAEGHQLAVKVEKALRQSIDNLYDVAVHVEPVGNIEIGEKYGLSSKEFACD
ncbi:MAG TPA: cation transporter [Firmicutes bacterium]|nr:cation transporter [Bacillota bacterium]HBT17927.1 cation transporter [Bacillota bacterium]